MPTPPDNASGSTHISIAAVSRGNRRASCRSRVTPPIGATTACCCPTRPSIVLSLYAGPFDLDTLSFANVARLLEQMPVPDPDRASDTPAISAFSRSKISGT